MASPKWQSVLLLAFAILGVCHGKPNLSKVVGSIDTVRGFTRRILNAPQHPQPLPGKLLPYGSVSLEFGRHLLQGGRLRCVWDEEDQECSLSDEAISNFTSKLNDDDAEKITELLACAHKGDEDSCVSSECIWNEKIGCMAKFLNSSFEQCISYGSKAINFVNADDTCEETYLSRDECNEDEKCSWDDESDECGGDVWQAFLGIPSEDRLPIGFTALEEARGEELIALVGENADPEAYLDLDPPPFNCPADAEPTVCELVELGDDFLKTAIYCIEKHPIDLIGCTEDPLCEVDEDGTCNVASSIKDDFAVEVGEFILMAIGDPIARRLLKTTLDCEKFAEPDCNQECEWDADDESCEIESFYLYKELGNEAEKLDTVDCQLLGTSLKSGCFLVESTEDCVAKEDCVWDFESGCIVQPDVVFNLLFRLDPDLKDYVALNEDCSRKTSEDACLSMPL